MIVRSQQGDVDAAVRVWTAANAGRELSDHPRRLKAWAQEPGAVLLVADGDGDGDLIGMALLLPGRADDGAGALIPEFRHLTGVSVLPQHWGRGVGGQLVAAALGEASRNGGKLVTLWAHSANLRAQCLFEAYGFRRTGRVSEDEAGTPMAHFEVSLTGTAGSTESRF